jgi:hypothetical protein
VHCVFDGLAQSDSASGGGSIKELGQTLGRLAPRWFVVRNAQAACEPILVQPRHTMSFLRGPMTGSEIRRARARP